MSRQSFSSPVSVDAAEIRRNHRADKGTDKVYQINKNSLEYFTHVQVDVISLSINPE